MTPQQVLDANPCLACFDNRTLLMIAVGYLSESMSGTPATGYTVASLRAETVHAGGSTPSIAYLVGFSAIGDGGQGFFVWKDTETGADDNGSSIIRAADTPFPSPGAWVRVS